MLRILLLMIVVAIPSKELVIRGQGVHVGDVWIAQTKAIVLITKTGDNIIHFIQLDVQNGMTYSALRSDHATFTRWVDHYGAFRFAENRPMDWFTNGFHTDRQEL